MKIVFMLEEPSAKSMLQVIVPKIIPKHIQVQYVSFDGKTNLEKELERKLRWWLEPDTCFLIMRDQDLEDCRVLKDRLLKIVEKSGKESVSVIRIACHELETFFLGDLVAVEKVYPSPVLPENRILKNIEILIILKNLLTKSKKLPKGVILRFRELNKYHLI